METGRGSFATTADLFAADLEDGFGGARRANDLLKERGTSETEPPEFPTTRKHRGQKDAQLLENSKRRKKHIPMAGCDRVAETADLEVF